MIVEHKIALNVTKNKPNIGSILLNGILGAAGSAFPLLLFITPGTLASLALSSGMGAFFISAVLAGGLLYFFSGLSGIYMFLCTLAAGFCLYEMLKRKRTYFDAALVCAAVITMAWYLQFNLYDLISGNPPFYTVQQGVRALWSEELFQPGLFSGILTDQQWALYADLGTEYANMLPDVLPAALCLMGAFMGLSNTVFCARSAARAKLRISKMRAFPYWRLPRSFTGGILVMLGGLLIIHAMNLASAQAADYAVLSVLAAPLAIQGLSVYWFFLSLRPRQVFAKGSMVLLLVLTFPAGIFIMAVFGLIEQVFHLREQIIRRRKGDE